MGLPAEGGRGVGWGGSGDDRLSLGRELVYSFKEVVVVVEVGGHSEKKYDDVMMGYIF